MSIPRIVTVAVFLTLTQSLQLACAQTLVWNPTVPQAAWDSTTPNWLNNGTPTAWIPNADAIFLSTASGTSIEISGSLTAASITFDTGATGIALVGLGRLDLAAVISSDAHATNSIATDILAPEGLALSGAGTLALGRVGGIITVDSGTLLATASDLSSAIIHVTGGAIATLGAPNPVANLLANASFEENPLDPNSYKYANASGGAIPAWGALDGGMIARCYPTLATSTWISGGSVPDGNHVMIIQRQGIVTQTFTVASAGLHQLSFYHFRRRGFPAHALTLAIDGIRLPPLLNIRDQFDAGRYVSVPFWLPVGAHTLSFQGCGAWYDSASMIDLAVIAPPSLSQPCFALGTDSSIFLAPGATATLDHSGDLPLALLDAASGNITGSGTWSASPNAYISDGLSWSPATPPNDISAILAFTDDTTVPSSSARHLIAAAPATISGSGSRSPTSTTPPLPSHA